VHLLTPGIYNRVDLNLSEKLRVLSGTLATRKNIPLPLHDYMFTRNPASLQFLEQDRLRIKEASANFYTDTLKLKKQIERIMTSDTDLSHCHLYLAENDVIIDNAKTLNLLEYSVGSIHTFKGMSHGIILDDPVKLAEKIFKNLNATYNNMKDFHIEHKNNIAAGS
jgi:hypothetical protein